MFEAIQTIKQNCRRCYTCVRDCPVKAIKIVEGQASVVSDRCIACGNCTMVCSQNAKTYASGLERTEELLESGKPVVALLAPSFPAEFPDLHPGRIVGALKNAGFQSVVEVAYGADLVSDAYREFFEKHREGIWISSSCPAVIEFVRKYQPDLVSRLIPVVSPMIATAIAVREMHPEEIRCVFIGPCIAKKLEARDPSCPPVVDEVITFKELKAFFVQKNISVERVEPRPFDPPVAGMGRAFPLSGGLLKSARLEVDLLNPNVITISGQQEVTDVLGAAARGEIDPFLIDPLMCQGCHDGPGMSRQGYRHNRKDFVRKYVNDAWLRIPETYSGDSEDRPGPYHSTLDLEREFKADDQRLQEPIGAGDPGDPCPDQQVSAGGRAQLQGLRVRHVPDQGRGGPPRPGRRGHVPSLHDRTGRTGLPRAADPLAGDPPGAPPPDQHGKARLPGAVGGRCGP